MYIVVKTRKFSENKVINILSVELRSSPTALRTCLRIIAVIDVCETVSHRAKVSAISTAIYIYLFVDSIFSMDVHS